MLHSRRWAGVVVFATAACAAGLTAGSDWRSFDDTIQALRVLQDDYFQPWLGTWPTSIDWTAAVLGSHVSGALDSMLQALKLVHLEPGEDCWARENMISLYFSQLVSFYFGQDALAIRSEAFDDMLWVVLGWLDTIQFIDLHSTLHYGAGSGSLGTDPSQQPAAVLRHDTWYGNVWVPSFSHRARVFWNLASAGWDTTLCGGGMNWNPRLQPYKNAITNELFIAASISMYLYFPGDANAAPFQASPGAPIAFGAPGLPEGQGWPSRDPRYLAAAIEGYKWLTTSGMVNGQGLYTDGFHISGHGNVSSNNTACDQRNDMVYTYNQGVLLTGQRGLFQVSGMSSYLDDGHTLIRSVIAATGWDLDTQRPVDNLTELLPGQLPPWRGLGRAGILEDVCDVAGDCSQDSQTFKGIYMHHFTTFCAPLELVSGVEPGALSDDGFTRARLAHRLACQEYRHWLRHNARAALGTRDSGGRYGMWWTAGLLNITTTSLGMVSGGDPVPIGAHATDYRTGGVPSDSEWMLIQGEGQLVPWEHFATGGDGQHPFKRQGLAGEPSGPWSPRRSTPRRRADARGHGPAPSVASDLNDRGRGRTVETQGGGLAVLRAYWESIRRSAA